MESQPITAFLSINLIVFFFYHFVDLQKIWGLALIITLDSTYRRIGKHSKLGFQGVPESPPNQETRQKAHRMRIISFISRELGEMNPGSREGDGVRGPGVRNLSKNKWSSYKLGHLKMKWIGKSKGKSSSKMGNLILLET